MSIRSYLSVSKRGRSRSLTGTALLAVLSAVAFSVVFVAGGVGVHP